MPDLPFGNCQSHGRVENKDIEKYLSQLLTQSARSRRKNAAASRRRSSGHARTTRIPQCFEE
jgi:hypothetical protein